MDRCRPGTRSSPGVRYLRYWVDEEAGRTFVEAGSAEDAKIVHAQAHGLVADEVFTVGSWKREDNENPRSLQTPDLEALMLVVMPRAGMWELSEEKSKANDA